VHDTNVEALGDVDANRDGRGWCFRFASSRGTAGAGFTCPV
jgi:hypothetical protein